VAAGGLIRHTTDPAMVTDLLREFLST